MDAVLDAARQGNVDPVLAWLQTPPPPSSPTFTRVLTAAMHANHPHVVVAMVRQCPSLASFASTALTRWALDSNHLDLAFRVLEVNPSHGINIAVRLNRVDAVAHLVARGADIDGFRQDALAIAVRARNVDMVRFLLDQGADVNARKGQALKEATSTHASKSIVLPLLAAGAREGLDDALIAVSRSRQVDLEVVGGLLAAGANVNAQEGRPLRNLCSVSHLWAAVRFYLDHGADPATRDSEAVVNAIHGNNTEYLQDLLTRGAHATPKAMYAAAGKNNVAAAAILLDHGLAQQMDNSAWQAALLIGVSNLHPEMVMLVADFCVPGRRSLHQTVTSASHLTHTPIHPDVQRRRTTQGTRIWRVLRARGAQISHADIADGRLLLKAASAGVYDAVEYLMTMNASAEKLGKAIFYASMYNFADVVGLLVRHPDIGAVHATELDRSIVWAVQHDNDDLVGGLVRAGARLNIPQTMQSVLGKDPSAQQRVVRVLLEAEGDAVLQWYRTWRRDPTPTTLLGAGAQSHIHEYAWLHGLYPRLPPGVSRRLQEFMYV